MAKIKNFYSVSPETVYVVGNVENFQEKVPAAIYTAKFNPQQGCFYLERDNEFTQIGEIYGDVYRRADRIVNAYETKGGNIGVLLSGEKGSGKTLLAKVISNRMVEKGVITVIVNSPYCKPEFFSFINSLSDDVVLIFDEFEKIFDKQQQNQLLTFLDGTASNGNRIVIFTSNETNNLADALINRPSRIRYHYSYRGIDEEMVRMYCEKNLNNKAHTESVVALFISMKAMNFDILKELVIEMNTHNETAQDSMEHLNITNTALSVWDYEVIHYDENMRDYLKELVINNMGDNWKEAFSDIKSVSLYDFNGDTGGIDFRVSYDYDINWHDIGDEGYAKRISTDSSYVEVGGGEVRVEMKIHDRNLVIETDRGSVTLRKRKTFSRGNITF